MRPTRERLVVCHVITVFDTGGAERVLLQTVRRLDQSRFHSCIVSLRPPGPLSPEAERTGVEVTHLRMGRRPGPATVLQLARFFRERRVDVAYGYLYDATIATRIAGRLARVPVVLTCTQATLSYLPRVAWWLDKTTARWCQRVVAVSRSTAEFVIEREGIPRDKVVVIANGVDVERFRPGDRTRARAGLGVSAEAFVVACVGRLHAQKGHRYLLAAMAAVSPSIPEFVCLVAGDGPLRSELEADAKRLGLGAACRFIGLRDRIHDVYDAADLTVLPSLYEGMPNVVLEAMAMGCPVVATAVSGSVEAVVDGVTGLLVPPADAPALGQAILALARDPERRRSMSTAARAAAEGSHSIDRMVKALEALYSSEWQNAMRRRGTR